MLQAEFFRGSPPEQVSQESAIISTELDSIVSRSDQIRRDYGGDPYIGTRQLFLAFLEPPIGGMTGDLVIHSTDNISIGRIVLAFRESLVGNPWVDSYEQKEKWNVRFDELMSALPEKSLRSKQVGIRHNWSREALDTEVGLRIDDYADALRDVFTTAGSGEFALAVFGHWGRGKTFLAKRLARRLAADGYKSIFFSAWKYWVQQLVFGTEGWNNGNLLA